MKPFDESVGTFRRGKTVPDGDVSLAYITAPELSPSNNVIVIDTTQLVEENLQTQGAQRKIMYADELGVLQDEGGNVAVPDEFPAITDVFSIDEDFSVSPGSEYKSKHVLAYRHVSRYFHLDTTGLAYPGVEVDYKDDHIKVVDQRGVEYDNYRIRIAPMYQKDNESESDLWAYRIFAYVDEDLNEDLYLTYTKVDIDADGEIVDRDVNYQEILNPQPFFDYVPEESEVVDPDNRDRRIYSSKPVSYEDQVLNKSTPISDGYRIYVPKKAVPDPRIYQTFRWRVKCTFTQDITYDPSEDIGTIKCGVIVTSADLDKSKPTQAPYALYNLARSRFNIGQLRLINPARTSHSKSEQKKRAYWLVNIDTDDLSDYDLLIWAPRSKSQSFVEYSSKVMDFVKVHGGTIFIDTTQHVTPGTQLGGLISPAVSASGSGNEAERYLGYSTSSSLRPRLKTTHPLIDGANALGGWSINYGDFQVDALSVLNSPLPGVSRPYTHAFTTPMAGDNVTPVVEVYRDMAAPRTLHHATASQKVGKGYRIVSTLGQLASCSRLTDYQTGHLFNANEEKEIKQTSNYDNHINSVFVEPAMKFFYNVVLLSVKDRSLDSSDEYTHSSGWTTYTDWRGSWVIDPDVLSEEEKLENNFAVALKDVSIGDTTPIYKRYLSSSSLEKLVDDKIASLPNSDVLKKRLENTTRTYELEFTNTEVKTNQTLSGAESPTAYTEAYSPPFDVPPELGAHVIQDIRDVDGKIGKRVEFSDTPYFHIDYPSQPYGGQVSILYATSSEFYSAESSNYTVTGTLETKTRITTVTPATTETTTTTTTIRAPLLDLWLDAAEQEGQAPGSPTQTGYVWPARPNFDGKLNWPDLNTLQFKGINSWQLDNYYTSDWGPGHRAWPDMNIRAKVQLGDTGDLVKFVQDAMNRFNRAGYFGTSAGILSVDGVFGDKTWRAVKDFLGTFKALNRSGLVDAEAWYIIGSQLGRLKKDGILGATGHSGHLDYFRFYNRLYLHRLSDGDNTWYTKRSNISGGPSRIWDLIGLRLPDRYLVRGVSLTSYLEGEDTDTIKLDSIHVTDVADVAERYNDPAYATAGWGPWLRNYSPSRSQLKHLDRMVREGNEYYMGIGPYRGDAVILGVSQSHGSGYGSSRMIGIADIKIHASIDHTTTTHIPETVEVTYQYDEVPFTFTGKATVQPFEHLTFSLNVPNSILSQHQTILNINYDTISFSNPDVVVTDFNQGRGRVTITSNVVESNAGSGVTTGPIFGSVSRNPYQTYYSRPAEVAVVSSSPEIGTVSKAEGVKLLCKADGKPYGFPALPTDLGQNEAQRHYALLRCMPAGNGTGVTVGFYDVAAKEFIASETGQSEMSFVEYMTRGPSNVYIAVLSDFEDELTSIVPSDVDAPRIPMKRAMPVYGVSTNNAGAKISLAPLPPRLNVKDVWPVAVRTGDFVRSVLLPRGDEHALTSWPSFHQGMTTHAFYSIPESERGGWSKDYGRPNVDVINEEPKILDDNVIQVRQSPVLVTRQYTEYPNISDPHRWILTVYKRDTVDSEWEKLPRSAIKDVNASTGEVFLKDPITSNDPALLRVDYTTNSRHYALKRDEDQILNLNPYMQDFTGVALHIYIVPHYVKDSNNRTIPSSVTERTLRATTNPGVFIAGDPNYNPYAVRLGVVYQTTAMDINDVTVLDTRSRGGGVKPGVDEKSIEHAMSFWDLGHGAGASYPKGGFVIVRLPESLLESMNESQVRQIVQDNMTAGVAFNLEFV